MNHTTCLLDPFNTEIIMQHSEHCICVFVHINNICFVSGTFPASLKAALLKKSYLDSEILKNFRPVSNLTFLSKLIEKVIANKLVAHLQDNGIMEKFQSAFKARHSTEMALLRVYNDMFCINQGNGCILLLLDYRRHSIQLTRQCYLIFWNIL